MAIDPLNHRMSFLATFLAFIGVVLGVVALATNYWTLAQVVVPGTALPTANGTFLTNENVFWTWNVSSTFIHIDFISDFDLFSRVFSINVQLKEMFHHVSLDFGQQHLSFV